MADTLSQNSGFLFYSALLTLLAFHIYQRLKKRRGYWGELCLASLVVMASFVTVGKDRNSLQIGPVHFVSVRHPPAVRWVCGNVKLLTITNQGKETVLTSVSVVSEEPPGRFRILEGEEYVKERREEPGKKTFHLAIPPGKRMTIQASDDAMLHPHGVYPLQFGGGRGYYSQESSLPPVRIR